MDTVSYTNPLNTLTLATARSTNFVPVMLPSGPVTMGAILSASTGVFVPFFLFVCFVFAYLQSIWRTNSQCNAARPQQQRRAPPPAAAASSSYMPRRVLQQAQRNFFANNVESSSSGYAPMLVNPSAFFMSPPL